MSDLKELHKRAMDMAEEAIIAKLNNDTDGFNKLSRLSFELEREVAETFKHQYEDEPTRSVLLRSAASLAIDCNDFREAERLICLALSGTPPDEIADELRDLLDQVYFQRHMELRGMALGKEEMQFSIAGSVVAPGLSPCNVFLERIESTEKLIYRTIERLEDIPFRERGPAKQAIQRNYDVFLSGQRAASMAITFQISYSEKSQQLTLPGYRTSSERIIDELMNCLDLFSHSEEKQLRMQIPDEAYYRNFVGLSKMIAPDGDKINFVGFTTVRNGKERKIGLTTSSENFPLPDNTAMVTKKPALYHGIGELRFADDRNPSNRIIILVNKSNKQQRILVPEGMMDDIVRPFWHKSVEVFGKKIGPVVHLERIREVEFSATS